MKKSFSIIFTIIALTLTTTSCSSDDDAVQQSSLAEITNFTLAFNGINAEDVDYKLGTNITVSVPFGTSLAGVVPTIALSPNATSTHVSGETINFVDGESRTFTVTAEDGTTKEYTVTVNVRNEVGSGSKLKTYGLADAWGEISISTYSYTESNFVKEISKEANDWGALTTTVTAFEYNSENQIIAKNVTATDETTVYTYEGGKIVKGEYSKEGEAIYTYTYIYNAAGDLASQKRVDHANDDAVYEVEFVIENGNVIEEIKPVGTFDAVYDDKNNPFIGIYPSAYAAIHVGIELVNINNPISGTLADNVIVYEYNEDNYPVSSSYTYFEGLATVDKTFTYFNE